jgi:hypothetical protein
VIENIFIDFGIEEYNTVIFSSTEEYIKNEEDTSFSWSDTSSSELPHLLQVYKGFFASTIKQIK